MQQGMLTLNKRSLWVFEAQHGYVKKNLCNFAKIINLVNMCRKEKKKNAHVHTHRNLNQNWTASVAYKLICLIWKPNLVDSVHQGID